MISSSIKWPKQQEAAMLQTQIYAKGDAARKKYAKILDPIFDIWKQSAGVNDISFQYKYRYEFEESKNFAIWREYSEPGSTKSHQLFIGGYRQDQGRMILNGLVMRINLYSGKIRVYYAPKTNSADIYSHQIELGLSEPNKVKSYNTHSKIFANFHSEHNDRKMNNSEINSIQNFKRALIQKLRSRLPLITALHSGGGYYRKYGFHS